MFYDNDEVALITERNFRNLQQPRDEDDLMRLGTWYYVNEYGVFPEEFVKFLSMNNELRIIFLDAHGEILTANYRREIKAKHHAGEISLVVPYSGLPMPERQMGKQQSAAHGYT